MGALRVVAAVFALGLVAVPSAGAQQRLVTYAARACPDYSAVRANLARNDIQESLKDLGKDTLYTSGEPISAGKELAGQPTCRPLTNWRFVLGTGYESQVVNGSWGSLSRVTSPYDTPIVTQTSTPLLNRVGQPVGLNLPGAVTVPLTDDQAERSQQGQSLWLQGGAVDDPVLDNLYPGQYGFAALRCAIDDLNGDNVEYIGVPERRDAHAVLRVLRQAAADQRHDRREQGRRRPCRDDAPGLRVLGNLSYNENNRFTLSAANGQPASETFYRAAGAVPWVFREEVPPGWSLTGLACTSANKTSTIIASLATGVSSVTLAASDTVTCTYTNQPTPRRQACSCPSARSVVSAASRSTSTARTPAARRSGRRLPASRSPARRPRARPASTRLANGCPCAHRRAGGPRSPSSCGGRAFDPLEPVELTIPAGQGAACGFTNRWIPGGSLRIRKPTIGGVATAHFKITPRRGEPARVSPGRDTAPPASPGDGQRRRHEPA